MQSLSTNRRGRQRAYRDRCYDCYRPASDCFCDAIPRIDNKTEVLILQHRRERFHPFNTARIVQRALRNARLLVDNNARLAAARLPLSSRCGLLYPGQDAELLAGLPEERRPRQLVIVDGTWGQSRTLLREIPALRELPRYRLAPAVPGRYRIRREPDAASLSTLEATVQALKILEPETPGLDRLLDPFHRMVQRQLSHPKLISGRRRKERSHRRAGLANIPTALIGDLKNVVVAYGESAPGAIGQRRPAQPPVYWTARRMVSGEHFARAIQPSAPLEDLFLKHLELTAEDFADALPLERFRAAWSEFLRPNDILAVYHAGTARLLERAGAGFAPYLVLKSVCRKLGRRHKTLEEMLADAGVEVEPPRIPCRAGKRLAQAIALVRYLSGLAGELGADS